MRNTNPTKPEIVFKVGAVRASVFRNTVVTDGRAVSLAKVILEVRYKDKNGEWKGTNSLSLNEVPKAILALNQAFAYLASRVSVGDDHPPASDVPGE